MRCRSSRMDAFTLVELLVVVAIFAVLLGMLLAAIQKTREAAHRLQCLSNLKQIGVALHAYHDANGCFPQAYDARALFQDPNQSGILPESWAKLILPFLDQADLARAGYAVYSERALPIYACPSDPRGLLYYPGNREYGKLALTDYLAVTGTMTFVGDPTVDFHRPGCDGVMYESSRTRMADITDGSSNTVLIGERPASPNLFWGWWSWPAFDASLGVRNTWRIYPGSGTEPYVYCPSLFPENYRAPTSGNCDTHHFWSTHPGGGNWLFADGSVRFLSYAANAVLPALATRRGGEVVQDDF